ncbi:MULTISPECIES: hypothetical protein [Paenibacillus]|uniref:hypothetical protein n=1 Tax=Paenibacillus TaxID=44249 RepID=UPI001C3102A7|nr:hypothetical protein [Paenibacillus sp. GbtcB18]
MKRKLGCYHAHYSNIEHIEKALGSYDIELVHFVDPGLDRIKNDSDFTEELAQNKIKSTLDWLASCHVDAILITCTYFTAHLPEHFSCPVPIIKIDDPLFHKILQLNRPSVLVFTNPSTVEGTMEQLHKFAAAAGQEIQVEPVLLENTFQLVMQGKKNDYIEAVSRGLFHAIEDHPRKTVFAAQLSMVPAAERVGRESDAFLGNHLDALPGYLKDILSLEAVGR